MNFIEIFNFAKYFRKPSDSTVARYGHINALADVALQAVSTDGLTITGDGTPGNPLVSAGGGSEYTETIVNISSAQMLGNGVYTLIPDLAASNELLVVDKIIVFRENVANFYNATKPGSITYSSGGSGSLAFLDVDFINLNTFKYKQLVFNTSSVNANLQSGLVYSNNNNGPTQGEGNFTFIIYHKTVTFGA